jgi:hypothetical protein
VRLGEKRDVVRFNKTHDPDAEVKFRELEHAFETQAFQDRLILGGAGLADALFEIHACAAHVLEGSNLFFGVEAVHYIRRAVLEETQPYARPKGCDLSGAWPPSRLEGIWATAL